MHVRTVEGGRLCGGNGLARDEGVGGSVGVVSLITRNLIMYRKGQSPQPHEQYPPATAAVRTTYSDRELNFREYGAATGEAHSSIDE